MKKTILKICLTIIIITTNYSCNDRSVVGIYLTENTKNTIDTLILNKEGKYERILRRKSNSSLIFKKRVRGSIIQTRLYPTQHSGSFTKNVHWTFS